jgi:hypothetical protein
VSTRCEKQKLHKNNNNMGSSNPFYTGVSEVTYYFNEVTIVTNDSVTSSPPLSDAGYIAIGVYITILGEKRHESGI